MAEHGEFNFQNLFSDRAPEAGTGKDVVKRGKYDFLLCGNTCQRSCARIEELVYPPMKSSLPMAPVSRSTCSSMHL